MYGAFDSDKKLIAFHDDKDVAVASRWRNWPSKKPTRRRRNTRV